MDFCSVSVRELEVVFMLLKGRGLVHKLACKPFRLTPSLLCPDTEILYTECTQQILDRFGKTFEWSVKSKMMGRPPLPAAQVLVEELQLPMTAQEFHQELYGNLMDKFPDAKLLKGEDSESWVSHDHNSLIAGAEELIQHIHSLGIPAAIATGSALSSYKKKISKYGHLFDGMSHAVCSDDPEVKSGKPAPDIYLVAAARFPSPPEVNSKVSSSLQQ